MSGKTILVRLAPVWCLVCAGCGGTPPAASPADAEPGAASTAPKTVADTHPQTEEATGESGTTPVAAETASDAPPQEPATASPQQEEPQSTEAAGPGDGRRPIDVLTAPTVAFMINYAASAPKEAAEQTCRDKEGDDLEARAQCIQKARSDFLADVLVFKKSGNGWAWTIYRRNRSQLLEVSTTQVDFANETANSVTIKVKGDKGQRPLFAGSREISVSVPSSSTIEIDDPKQGRLVYEAKVGLVANE